MVNTPNFGIPMPDVTADVDDEFYRLETAWMIVDAALAALDAAIGGRAATVHSHAIVDVIGLTAALAGKMDGAKTFSLDELTDVEGAADAAVNYVLVKNASEKWVPSSALAALGNHQHAVADILGLSALLADVASVSGFRNHIQNGDFWLGNNNNGWGTLTATQNGKFVGDRWKLTISPATGTTTTISQQSHPVGETLVPGGGYFFLRIERTATGAGDLYISQGIERVRPLAGKKVTLTYSAKGTPGKQIEASYSQNFGTGGSPSAPVSALIQAVPLTAGWVRQSHVFTLPSVSGKILGTNLNNYLDIKFKMPAAQGNMTFDVDRVSLVEGDASQEADPFSPRHTALERLMCQRHFWKAAPGEFLMQGHVTGAGSGVYMSFRHPVQMRAVPTMTTTFATSGNIGTPIIDRISNRSFAIGATGTSTGGAYSIDTSGDFIADAEF